MVPCIAGSPIPTRIAKTATVTISSTTVTPCWLRVVVVRLVTAFPLVWFFVFHYRSGLDEIKGGLGVGVTNGPLGRINGNPPFHWLCRSGVFAYALLAVVAGAGALALAQPQPVLSLANAQFFGLVALWGAWSVTLTLALGCWMGKRFPQSMAAWQGGLLWLVWVGSVALVGSVAQALGWVTHPGAIARASALAGLVGWGLWWALAGWREEWSQRLLAQEAQQAVLLARTHPHFLLNTLNVIAGLLPDQPQKAERALEAFCTLLHNGLTPPNPWSLADELAAARTYLDLAALRFGERLQQQWQLPEDEAALGQIIVPRWVVVPLVENGVIHGVAKRKETTPICLTVTLRQQSVTVAVANPMADGAAHPPSPRVGHGIGLAIVAEQIRRCGGNMSVSRENGWFVVSWALAIDYRAHDGNLDRR